MADEKAGESWFEAAHPFQLFPFCANSVAWLDAQHQ